MKKMIVLILALFCLASLTAAQASSTPTTKELIAKIGQIRKEKLPGKFTRVSPETLKFEGYLVKESYPEYLKNIDGRVKTLIVTSPGGDTNSSVKIAIDILKRKLTVRVEGVAASSAANYLFLAGQKKIIDRGFVGFHGNAQALLAEAGDWEKLKREMKEKYKINDQYFAEFKKELEETIGLEKRFYRELNIPQYFFTVTQAPGKGLTSGPEDGFDFLLPSIKTMGILGIKNVSGRQDIELAEKLGLKVIYY